MTKCIQRQQETNCDIVNTWSNVIDSNTQKRIRSFSWINNGTIHHKLLTGKCYVDNSSTLIRKSLLEDIGLLSEDCPAFQEWDTHIRLSNIAVYQTIEESLIDYYVGAIDAISSNKQKDIKGYYFILSKFKKEWINKCPLHFCKYAAILYNCIKATEISEKDIYLCSFSTLTGVLKPFILVMAKIINRK